MFFIEPTTMAMLKKKAVQAILDERTRKRLITVLITILVVSFIVVITIASVPTILINTFVGHFFSVDEVSGHILENEFDPNAIEDMGKVAIYQDTIIVIDQLNKKWIEETKAENNDCDEFEVNYNYSLTWESLISIDSVLLRQDFEVVDSEKIIELGLKFITRDVNFETREIEEEYEVENEDGTTSTRTRTIIIRVCIITIDTKEFSDVLPEVEITDEEDVLLATNIFETISFIDLEENLNLYDSPIRLDDLKEYPPGNADIPYYNQTDRRWGADYYGSSSIAGSGCGPTSLAMVVSGLTGRKITPDMVAGWSVANGHRAEGAGSYWSLMTAGGNYYGLSVEAVSRKDPDSIVKALSEGNPIIVSMGKGHFTNGGHFIVLRGITENGKILIHDPSSVNRSNKEWDLSIIMNESSKNGGVNGSPFWIFSNNDASI